LQRFTKKQLWYVNNALLLPEVSAFLVNAMNGSGALIHVPLFAENMPLNISSRS